ncbi:MAG: hypothetical protein ABSC55_03790 [Syntrophorhabdales bacterium]
MNEVREEKNDERWVDLKGWFYVCGLALFFLLYGLFMFYMIGDKGPPGWDFGIVEDIPGESVYSMNEPITGGTAAPEPQHVSQKPQQAEAAVEKEKP